MSRVLAVRLDSAGDVLLTGPAIRALAAGGNHVDVLASRQGAEAARLLPAVEAVVEFDAPWSGEQPPTVEHPTVGALVDRLAARAYDEAVIFTSYHQSPLPMALLARLAGVPFVAAASDDYPGSLLDVRARRMPDGRDDTGGPEGGHEVTAALHLAQAAGHVLPAGDRAELRVRRPLPLPPVQLPEVPYAVLHPGASVPARGITAAHAEAIAAELLRRGWAVVVTGSARERELVEAACPPRAVAVAGGMSLAGLAAVLERAEAVVVGNTGPAHLAAAVGTPVVSLFAPVVPAARWAPWGVPSALLGDQDAPCAGSRARVCPVPGHPCVASVDPKEVAAAVERLVGDRVRVGQAS